MLNIFEFFKRNYKSKENMNAKYKVMGALGVLFEEKGIFRILKLKIR